ncbi:hypothetical protein D3C78_1740520 [compost metagenome]
MRGFGILLGAALRGRTGAFRRRGLHARAPGLGQSDRNGLFGGTHAMLAFAHVFDFLAHEFAGLRGRGLAFALVLLGTLQGFSFRHGDLLAGLRERAPSPVETTRRNS